MRIPGSGSGWLVLFSETLDNRTILLKKFYHLLNTKYVQKPVTPQQQQLPPPPPRAVTATIGRHHQNQAAGQPPVGVSCCSRCRCSGSPRGRSARLCWAQRSGSRGLRACPPGPARPPAAASLSSSRPRCLTRSAGRQNPSFPSRGPRPSTAPRACRRTTRFGRPSWLCPVVPPGLGKERQVHSETRGVSPDPAGLSSRTRPVLNPLLIYWQTDLHRSVGCYNQLESSENRWSFTDVLPRFQRNVPYCPR